MRLSSGETSLRGVSAAVACALGLLALGGCKVVSIAEDRAMRERASAAFDAREYGAGLWTRQALPFWTQAETPLDAVIADAKRDLTTLGERQGRRAGDGSPWIFVVTGEGVVEQVEPAPRGRVRVRLADGTVAEIQTGPAVSGAALRDSLPFVRFDDFSNQLVYADVAASLNAQATATVRGVAGALRPGDRVAFAGVVPISEPGETPVVTPYKLSRGAT